MKPTVTCELKVYALCALLVLRAAIYAGSITFLIAYALVVAEVVPLPDDILYLLTAAAFTVGGFYAAKQILEETNPRRFDACEKTRARMWLWPFLTFSWAAVFFANPYLLVVAVVSEGIVAAYPKALA